MAELVECDRLGVVAAVGGRLHLAPAQGAPVEGAAVLPQPHREAGRGGPGEAADAVRAAGPGAVADGAGAARVVGERRGPRRPGVVAVVGRGDRIARPDGRRRLGPGAPAELEGLVLAERRPAQRGVRPVGARGRCDEHGERRRRRRERSSAGSDGRGAAVIGAPRRGGRPGRPRRGGGRRGRSPATGRRPSGPNGIQSAPCSAPPPDHDGGPTSRRPSAGQRQRTGVAPVRTDGPNRIAVRVDLVDDDAPDRRRRGRAPPDPRRRRASPVGHRPGRARAAGRAGPGMRHVR